MAHMPGHLGGLSDDDDGDFLGLLGSPGEMDDSMDDDDFVPDEGEISEDTGTVDESDMLIEDDEEEQGEEGAGGGGNQLQIAYDCEPYLHIPRHRVL